MANIGEVVAALRQTAAGFPFTALADALGLVEEARSLVEGAAAGSGQDEFLQVIAWFNRVVDGIEELQRKLTAIQQSVTAAANRLEGQGAQQGAAPHLDHVQARLTASPQQLLAGLPTRADPGGKTSGYWVGQDGGVHGPIVSGRGELREQAVEGLRRLGLVSPRGTLTVADHVEVQVAVQVQTVAGDIILAVNNRPCDVGPLSCDRVVPRVLRPGQRLTVYWPGGTTTYVGRER